MQIQIVKSFKACVGGAIYPSDFPKSLDPIDVDKATAELAIKEGWAKPVDPTPGQSGHPSHDSGSAQPSVSSEPGPVSRASKRSKSKANAKR